MHASWLLRSARGQAAILELPSMRMLSGRAPAGQAKVPNMQVLPCCQTGQCQAVGSAEDWLCAAQMRFLAASVSLQACTAGEPDEVSSASPEPGRSRDFQLHVRQVCGSLVQPQHSCLQPCKRLPVG